MAVGSGGGEGGARNDLGSREVVQDQPRDEHELAAGQWRAAADPATVARVAVPGHRSVQQNLLIWRKIKKGCFSKVSESELYMLLKAKKPQAVCIGIGHTTV